MIEALAIAALRGTAKAENVDVPVFMSFLRKHGIAVLVRGTLAGVSEELASSLADVHRAAVMRAMMQERAISELGGDVPFTVWRGLQLARLLYDDPSERVGADIDLLVAPHDKEAAIAQLIRTGYVAHPQRATESHELHFSGHGVELDLHWDVFRPGRAGTDLAAWALDRGLDSTATALLTLVHTAITEHVTGRLIRAVDINRLLRRSDVDWDTVEHTLELAGLKGAAWLSLKWTERVFDTSYAIAHKLAPGRMRQRYLLEWLEHDPAALYQRAPLAVRSAFSLALQDDLRGAVRAVVGLARSR